MNAAAYVRVSSKAQDDATQRSAIERAARARGDAIADWRSEKRGARTMARSDQAVHTLKGAFLGRFRSGFFRDQAGRVVAFTPGATGGLPLPLCVSPPVPPVPPVPPTAPLPTRSPLAPLDSLSWGVDWEQFLRGEE